MTGPAVRRASEMVALALAVVCWAFSCLHADSAAAYDRRAVLGFDNAPISALAADELLDAEQRAKSPLSFAVWQQTDAQQVENQSLHRFADVSVVTVRGSTALIFPNTRLLSPDDTNGCLLDAVSARALFGSENAAGGRVEWNGREYTVRGVFHAPATTMLVRENLAAALNRVTLMFPAQKNARALTNEFTMRHALVPERTVYFDFPVAAAGLGVWLPGIFLAFALAGNFAGAARVQRAYPVRRWLWLLGGAAIFCGMLWLCGVRLTVPQEMIPTRWSDFEFWERLATTRGDELKELLWMKKERPDISLLSHMIKSLLWGGASAVLFKTGGRSLTAKKHAPLPLTLAACLAGGFCAVLLAGKHGLAARHLPMLWLAPPIYCAAACFVREHLSHFTANIEMPAID